MQTAQRHPDPYIPPWTDQWSTKRRLGFGFLAILPLTMLTILFVLVIANLFGAGFETDLLPVLFYTHVGTTFITLLVYAHLMFANPRLTRRAKGVWAALYFFAAPFSIPVYWGIHIWARDPMVPDAQTPHSTREHGIHVYDYDYTGDPSDRVDRREDGAVVHHVDATT